MNEKRFWEIVKEINWADPDKDHDVEKVKLLKNLSYVELGELQAIYGKKASEVEKASGHDYCYDSWSDCIAHIVGLGKEEFDRNIKNPKLIAERLGAGDFRESFSYVVPYPDGLRYLMDDHYSRRAYDLIDELESIGLTDNRRDKLYDAVCLVSGRQYKKAVEMFDAEFPEYSDPLWNELDHGYGYPNLFGDIKKYKIN